MTVVEVSITCVHVDPAPMQQSPRRTTCAWEGGDGPCNSRSPWLKEKYIQPLWRISSENNYPATAGGDKVP